jgi:hypothetical protein
MQLQDHFCFAPYRAKEKAGASPKGKPPALSFRPNPVIRRKLSLSTFNLL